MAPTPRLILLVALAVIPAAAALATPDAIPVVGVVDAGLGIAVLVALLRRVPPDAIRVTRSVKTVQFVRGEAEVALELENRFSRALWMQVRDLPPVEVDATGLPIRVWLASGARAQVRYRIQFPRRGRHRFGDVHVRLTDRLGLLSFDTRVPARSEIRVYPAPLASGGGPLALLRRTRADHGSGKTRSPGEGGELDGLRRFVAGDDPRFIDWKATARRGVPIAREMRPERNQRLMLVIDLGRALHPSLGRREGSKLDRALEAAHELAVLGLEGGDEVGLVAFGSSVRTSLPPQRGAAHGRRLLDTLLDLQSEPVEPLYPEAFRELGKVVSRRSLVVLFTDLIDTGSSQTVIECMTRLRPRHLPLCVTVEDSALRHVAEAETLGAGGILRKAAARELLADQKRVLGLLGARGVLTVHVPAAELAAATVNRYVEIKFRAML